MATAPRSGEAEHVIVAPTGPLIVPALAAGDAQPVLSLVVPTLNERENITDFLAAVRHNLDQALPGRYEVIVVDDDSADRTWEIAARLCADFPALRVVRRQNEGGLAVAVIRGWQVARGQMLGTINADFQHPPDVLGRLLERRDGADLVVATRHGDGGGLGDWGMARRDQLLGRRADWPLAAAPGLRARFRPAERLLRGAAGGRRRRGTEASRL